ncbi:chemotaxis protein MotB [Chitinophaga skermanii]|uniref:Chemotaxis protein MotB n=1 Tax=Chitinophaga skermanii TaxID=331697 RepID=A0A327QEG0_9BACT|nr:OmpA family protein [Chitinophaga skermanii]RAJ02395.1 chemotaxis protein MotB [Chitinophaga skermanii]
MRLQLAASAVLIAFLASCSAPKKLKESEARYTQLQSKYNTSQQALQDCNNELKKQNALSQQQITHLNAQIAQERANNDQMIGHLRDLSVISSSQAESIQKSLANINSKDAYIKDLQSAMARKDSLNMALVMNLKGVIGNMDDQDIDIKIDKGVVYIDISDKLLFKTGSYEVTDRAREVLGKVAKVLNNQPQIEFMVEGHTDPVPFARGVLLDNWDLSVKRATSVVRILQNEYHIPPARMTAAGRSEYVPVTTNDTAEGRSKNRRTRIVILPELDQFFKLLETPQR